ncbi:MAG: metal ABC transporter permease [Bacteroidetes bacterium]|jgi:ABC-type Mn2+/Zn2+ transport system permease subunit|nr:metal ABC transporter permease [Bacteroidota bacterium]
MSDWEILRTIVTDFPHALAGSMIAGLLCAVLGVYVVSRRVVFVGMTLTEIAVAGVAFAHLVSADMNPTLGSLILTVVAVLVFTRLLQSRLIPRDTVLGASYILAITLRILMMQKTQGAEVAEIESILKGDMLFVTPEQLVLVAGTAVVLLIVHALFFKQFLFVSLDAETAATQGIRSERWDFLFYLTIAIAVSVTVRIVGDIFVFGFLILPSVAAMLAIRNIKGIFIMAAIFGLVPPILGLYLAFKLDFPAGPTTVAAAFLLLIPHLLRKRA